MKNILKIFAVLFLTLNIMPVLAVDDSDASSQSKANRLLTSASSVATGIGGMELAQGLAEQKADKAADADMSAYISTMRCSYGSGKSVKAGTEEIELPGGNSANLMQYRSEYVALASDLKERKNALDMTPGIESEEILDKSQMGLYDDENVGITGGRYASLYRAQMLGSESDQAQLDEAKQTSKTRVIGGAVAAGVGVVGGIVGDELINQSLSSSTKTAQTCTESGGTWQGARCHCPDGFIQRTKTGPCFEEQPTEVQTTTKQQTPVNQGNPTPPQDNNPNLSSGSNGDDNGQYGDISDDNNDAGDSDEKGDSSIVDIADISFEEDEFEETDDIPDEAVQYEEKQKNCTNSNGEWKNGVCTCKDKNYTLDASGKCVINFGGTNIADKYTKPTVVPAVTQKVEQNKDNNDSNEEASPNTGDSPDNQTTQQQTQGQICGVVGKKECNSNYYVCESDDDCTSDKLPANATAGRCWQSGNRSVCTATACEAGFKLTYGYCKKSEVAGRNTNAQKTNTPSPQRANTTNGKTTNNNDLSKQDMSKNGTFAKAYGADGKCSVYQNKSWADNSKSWCDDLYKGEWKVQFDYGLVRGKAACAKNGGAEKSLGTPAGETGQYCWCKVIQYTPNGGAAKNLPLFWMYNKGDYSEGSCKYHCALWCASDIKTDPSIRQKMFNAK